MCVGGGGGGGGVSRDCKPVCVCVCVCSQACVVIYDTASHSVFVSQHALIC